MVLYLLACPCEHHLPTSCQAWTSYTLSPECEHR